jgi:hypothetical protein
MQIIRRPLALVEESQFSPIMLPGTVMSMCLLILRTARPHVELIGLGRLGFVAWLTYLDKDHS